MAQTLKIYRKVDGVDTEIVTSPELVIDDFQVSLPHMDVRKITGTFYYPERIEFQMNEYTIYEKEGTYAEGDTNATEKYYLFKPPVSTKDNTSLMIRYDFEFVAKHEILKNVPMIDSWEVQGNVEGAKKPSLLQLDYTFFGGVTEYFQNIKSSMIAEFGGEETIDYGYQPKGWTLILDLSNGYPQVGDDQQITVSNITVFDALVNINELFKVPFFFNSSTSVTVGGEKITVPKTFRYGKDKGLVKIIKTPTDDTIITKIRGVGSERNIPHDYLSAEKALATLPALPMSRLMPKVYRDSLTAKASNNTLDTKDYYTSSAYNEEFPKPSFETFEDIFPTISGATYGDDNHAIDEITGVYFVGEDVEDENEMIINGDSKEPKNPNFWVRIPALGFNLNDSLNAKEQLVLSPTEGQCGGCIFNVLQIGATPSQWKPVNENFAPIEAMQKTGIQGVSVSRENKTTQIRVESNEITTYLGDEIQFNVDYEWGIELAGHGNLGQVEIRVGFFIDNYDVIIFEPTIPDVVNNTINSSVSDSDKQTEPIQLTIDNDEWPEGVYKFFIELYANVNLSSEYDPEDEYIWNNSYANAYIKVTDPICTVNHVSSSISLTDTTDEPSWLLLQKDIDTYSTLLPYVINPIWTKYNSPALYPTGAPTVAPSGLVPKIGDKFVFLGITLPQSYITAAEQRLENALLNVLDLHQEHKYRYDTIFDEKVFLEEPELMNSMVPGSIIEIYEENDPHADVFQADKIEVVVNGLTLKYSADKTITINAE